MAWASESPYSLLNDNTNTPSVSTVPSLQSVMGGIKYFWTAIYSLCFSNFSSREMLFSFIISAFFQLFGVYLRYFQPCKLKTFADIFPFSRISLQKYVKNQVFAIFFQITILSMNKRVFRP